MAASKIRPGSFDTETARHMLGDERARAIEAKAREDAGAGLWLAPECVGGSYLDGIRNAFERSVYANQWGRRDERNKRKASAASKPDNQPQPKETQ